MTPWYRWYQRTATRFFGTALVTYDAARHQHYPVKRNSTTFR